MGKLIVTEFMTLDGVAQAPGGPDEDASGSFPHGGWQAPFIDQETGRVMFEQASSMDALLLGRRTYEMFASYWPNVAQEVPFAGLLNRVHKYVASHTLTEPLAWQPATLLAGDLAESIAELTSSHSEVHVIGSLHLVQSLLRRGLVDQLNLWVYPLVLGTGKRVFAEGTAPATLRLRESVTYPSGTIHAIYDPAGPPAYGTIGAES